MTGGDFDTARNELARVKDAEKRDLYTQVLIKERN